LYNECITIDRYTPWYKNKNLNRSILKYKFIRCATTADYDRDMKWGNCVEVKCFKVIDDEMDYIQARSYCYQNEARLASIHTRYEQAYVTALLRNRTYNAFYIGGLSLFCV